MCDKHQERQQQSYTFELPDLRLSSDVSCEEEFDLGRPECPDERER